MAVRVTNTRQRQHQPDLVIFDCDGVLVDSEVISCRVHAELLSRHGYPITSEQVLSRFLGISDREARATIEAEIGRKLPDDFEAQMKQAALQSYASDLVPIRMLARQSTRLQYPNVSHRAARRKRSCMAFAAPVFTTASPHTFSPPRR
jgi:beta-phosphoglucomutase-like phosphatase (HAD superfamily)